MLGMFVFGQGLGSELEGLPSIVAIVATEYN